MQKHLFILILCSFAFLLTLGGSSPVSADKVWIDQDYPIFRHGMIVIYHKDPGSNPPSTVTLSGGPSGTFDYDMFKKKTFPNGTEVYVSNFIKPVTNPSNQNRYQVVMNQTEIVATVNGIPSAPTNSAWDYPDYDYIELFLDGYSMNPYEITLNIDCDSNSAYGNGLGNDNDDDNDGLCDAWETDDGLNVFEVGVSGSYFLGCNGNKDYDVDPLGTEICPNPEIPDLYFEIDSMQGHRPNLFALEKVASSFQKTLIEIDDGTEKEINVHFQISDGTLPHVLSLPMPGGGIMAGYDVLKTVWFGTSSPDERGTNTPNPQMYWQGHQRDLKSQAFHYIIMAHGLLVYGPGPNDVSDVTGAAELPGNDSVITLGFWDFKVGNEDHHAGTLVHEIGHNINLHHGGGDSVNCKPNYLSVMSYSRQFPDLIEGIEASFSNNTFTPFDERTSWNVPAGYETVYGLNSGNSYQNLTGPATVPASSPNDDVNHINAVDCDGTGDVFNGFEDSSLIQIMNRQGYSTYDEGRGSGPSLPDEAAEAVHGADAANKARDKAKKRDPNNPAWEKPVYYTPCKNNVVSSIAPGSDESKERTCILETLSYHEVSKIRTSVIREVQTEIRENNYLESISPECRGTFMSILTTSANGIENRQTITQVDLLNENAKEEILEKWDENAINIRNAINDLNSEKCIPDPEDRAEIIEFLEKRLNTVLRAVPEFETVAITILSISIISVLVITKKTKLNFGTQY